MATARKLPSGSWRVRVFDYKDDSGKRHYRSFTCDEPGPVGKARCEQMATDWLLGKKRKEEMTLSKSLSSIILDYIDIRRPVLSPSTIRNYVAIHRRLSKDFPSFLESDVGIINSEYVQLFVNDLCEAGYSPKTIRNTYGLITSSIHHFCSDVTIRCKLPQKKKPQLYIPSDDDVKMLIQSISGTELEVPVLLAAFGAMRRSEIAALTINDIDAKGVAHVCKARVKNENNEYVEKTTKTVSSDRFVALPDFVVKKIRAKGYVTTYQADRITKNFAAAVERLGVPHFRFHDLRHYSASIMHAMGIPDAYIMQRGGWATDTVLKEVYRHAMDSKQAEMNNKINNYFSSNF